MILKQGFLKTGMSLLTIICKEIIATEKEIKSRSNVDGICKHLKIYIKKYKQKLFKERSKKKLVLKFGLGIGYR